MALSALPRCKYTIIVFRLSLKLFYRLCIGMMNITVAVVRLP
jgi:hypothetical protein